MKKLFLYIVLLFVTLIGAGHIHAQDKAVKYNERWTCLDVIRPDEDPTIQKFPPPAEYMAAFNAGTLTKEMVEKYFATDPRFIWYNHGGVIRTKGSSADKPLPNADTYIVTCIQLPLDLPIPATIKKQLNNQIPKEVCTTGDSKTDMYIWNNDRHKLLEDLYSGWDNFLNLGYKAYRFYGYYKKDLATKLQPENTTHIFKTDARGNFTEGEFVYVDATWKNTGRKFMAYNRFPDNEIPMGTGGEQQGTFTFDGANKNCVQVSWDPYGRVFDSKTLEPVPDALVTLSVNKNGTFIPMVNEDMPAGFISNPQSTPDSGDFSFIVPDGIYRLKVEAKNYVFPSKTLNDNYRKIYSDIYHGENIIQKGKMIHRDIPVDFNGPESERPKSVPVKIVGLFQTTLAGGITVIDGTVSKPLSEVRSYCKKPNGIKGTSNKSVQANKQGKFSLEFNSNLCDKEKGEMYGIIEVNGVNLAVKQPSGFNLFSILSDDVNAQSRADSSYVMDPIPSYIEGYAYNNSGKIIPKALIGIYAVGDSRPYRTVTADENGYFDIYSNNLPNSPYYLKYSGSVDTTMIDVSITKFISQNYKTIAQKKINLYAYNTEKVPKVVFKNERSVKSYQPVVEQTPAAGNKVFSSMLIILAIISFLTISVIVILFLYIKNKNSSVIG